MYFIHLKFMQLTKYVKKSIFQTNTSPMTGPILVLSPPPFTTSRMKILLPKNMHMSIFYCLYSSNVHSSRIFQGKKFADFSQKADNGENY